MYIHMCTCICIFVYVYIHALDQPALNIFEDRGVKEVLQSLHDAWELASIAANPRHRVVKLRRTSVLRSFVVVGLTYCSQNG